MKKPAKKIAGVLAKKPAKAPVKPLSKKPAPSKPAAKTAPKLAAKPAAKPAAKAAPKAAPKAVPKAAPSKAKTMPPTKSTKPAAEAAKQEKAKSAAATQTKAAPPAAVAKAAPEPAPIKVEAQSAPAAPKQIGARVPKPRPATELRSRTAPRKPSSEFKNFTPYAPAKGESYMNEEQKNHFRGILLSWRDELMVEVDRTVSHIKDEAANFPDPADRATQEEEFSLELRTRDRERKLIKKIESTLDLIDQDVYGYCDACGVDIGIKRLEARPTATLCIDCKTLEEIKERQEHG